MDKFCPIMNKNCIKDKCMAYRRSEIEVPVNFPKERLIKYKDGKPITPTKTIVREDCLMLSRMIR